MHHIYAYVNNLNGKIYVGQTIDPKTRDYDHTYKNPVHKSLINHAIRKYGRDNFDLWTIVIVSTQLEADQEEIFWISEMRNQLGRDMVYNLTDGGEGRAGYKHSPETIEKISQSAKGRDTSKAVAANIAANTGKPKPAGFSEQLSKRQTGVPRTEHTRKKISQSSIGKVMSPESRKKMSKAAKKRRWKLVDGKRIVF